MLVCQVRQFHKQGEETSQQFNLGKFAANLTDVDEINSEIGTTGASLAYVREVSLCSMSLTPFYFRNSDVCEDVRTFCSCDSKSLAWDTQNLSFVTMCHDQGTP